MMSMVELDSKGRLMIPKEIRDQLRIGRKVLMINAGNHMKIISLSIRFKSWREPSALRRPLKNSESKQKT